MGESSEPRFMALPSNSPEVLKAVADSRSSLDFFFDTFAAHKTNLGVFFGVKIAVNDGDTTAHLWYAYKGEENGMLLLEHFELPKELIGHESKKIRREEIEDWMINDHGHLYGGFSIRLQRSKTPKEKQAEFDEYSGIRVYKILDYQKRIDLTPTN